MEQPMIRATIRMAIPPRKSDEAQRILRRLVRECGDDPGCLNCHIYGDLQDENVLVLEQTWKTQESLDLHLRSDVYRNLLLVVEMSLVKPEIRFDTISDSAGIEAIEKARSQS
jgi:quinol monooxygenase YgiN